jgi:hypothetical protein
MLPATLDVKRGEGLVMSCFVASRTVTTIDAAIPTVEANRSTKRPRRPHSTQQRGGGRCWSDSFRHTGKARLNANAATEALLTVMLADLVSHEGILRGEEIEAEP